MCGIAGIVDFRGEPVDPSLLSSMGQALAHRGPDDEGYALVAPESQSMICCRGPATSPSIAATLQDLRAQTPRPGFSVGLVHRRFSIIDLTTAGHQPFVAPGNWVLSYNGEIYNYLELRSELEQAGASFESHTDTEVVLKAYMKWGSDCFRKFNGFWSLAIYDPQKRGVVLSRDRLGVKPLYYMIKENRLYFASEIKALLKVSGEKSPSVDEGMADDWIRFGIKDHTEATCFSGVRKFPAASWAVVDADFRNNFRKFWSIPSQRKSVGQLPVSEAVATCRELLTDAIRLRLRADVPLAVSLSGGLDSSALVALAKNELGIALPSFTVGFSDPSANESEFARAVATACGSELTVLEPPPGSVWQDIESFTDLEEEPYHSPNLYVEQLVWSRMRAQGIKVVLNGAAGDENFGGYGFHYSLMQRARLLNGDLVGYARGAATCADTSGLFTALTKPIGYALREQLRGTPHRNLNLQRRLIEDIGRTLMPYWLASGDRSYMGVPIEVREPFLDYRVVEFAFSMPLEYLVRDGWQKWILRKAVEPYLPAEVVWRKRKMGFPFPARIFLSQHRSIINSIIRSSSYPGIRKRSEAQWGSRWNLISFLLWYEWFISRNQPLFDVLKELSPKKAEWPWVPEYLKRSS